ncbi:MAG: hypothetical protein AAB686_02430 [Patescibacteria group bacterium]
MTRFEDQYFQKFSFDRVQIGRLLKSAKRSLRIAAESRVPEVVFKFSYEALIKLGIVAIARRGYRVRSAPGHHMKILEKLSELLGDENIVIVGNRMRQVRNLDLYEGGDSEITEKESRDYLDFVRSISKKIG